MDDEAIWNGKSTKKRVEVESLVRKQPEAEILTKLEESVELKYAPSENQTIKQG